VTFEEVEGGFKVASSALSVTGTVPDVDAAAFTAAAEGAKEAVRFPAPSKETSN